MNKLFEHTSQKQLSEQTAKVSSLQGELADQKAHIISQNDQIAELTMLLKTHLSSIMAAAALPIQAGVQQAEVIHNQQATSITNTTTHVTLNIFGQEATDYITAADIQRLASDPEVAEKPALLSARLCDLIFAHREHPENRTAYIPNKKEPYALIYTGEAPKLWQVQPVPQVLRKMVRRSGEEICSKVNIHDTKVLQEMQAEIGTIAQARTDAIYNIEQLAADLKPELSTILLNNKPDRAELALSLAR